jgi:formiminoglutamase
MNDPLWPTAASLLKRNAESAPCDVGIIGVPTGRGAITPGRCDLAPASIRAASAKLSTYDGAHNIDLQTLVIADFGDVDAGRLAPAEALAPISECVGEALDRCRTALVVLGGDNSVTRAAFRGVLRRHPLCGLMTLDAHHDVRETTSGLNNGNPIRALIEDGVPGDRIVQIGIQPFANSAAYARFARESGIAVWTINDVWRRGIGELIDSELARLSRICDRIYVDLDIDVLDRAFCPSAAGSRPGGMVPRELFEAVWLLGVHPKVRSMDIVEHDPERDIGDLTALVAAESVVRFMAGVTQRKGT